ncbi:MAG: hypothetical protein AAGA71_15130 [Pseudomonadota bacterium]
MKLSAYLMTSRHGVFYFRWPLLGSDHAAAELESFFSETGLSREAYREHIPMVLNEIRKARIAAHKAIVEFGESLGDRRRHNQSH